MDDKVEHLSCPEDSKLDNYLDDIKISDTIPQEQGHGDVYSKSDCEILKRINTLRETMYDLKKQLREEKNLWRKEMEEFSSFQLNVLEYSLASLDKSSSELNRPKFRLEALEPFNIKKSSIHDINVKGNEYSTQTYEKKLAICEEELAQVHVEKKQQMHRKLAAYLYKNRLDEVERMCMAELARVRRSASFLEPLNKIASKWNLPSCESLRNKPIHSPELKIIHESNRIRVGNHLKRGAGTPLENTFPDDGTCPKIDDLKFARELTLGQTSSPEKGHECISIKMSVKAPIWQGTIDQVKQENWFSSEEVSRTTETMTCSFANDS